MKAILVNEDKSLRWDNVPKPICGEEDCIVKIEAAALNRGARWIMIAALAGTKTQIDLKNIYVRNVRIIGSTLRSRAPEVKAQLLGELVRKVWSKVESGAVKPTIYKALPITEAEAAHDLLYRGKNVGKVVLTVD